MATNDLELFDEREQTVRDSMLAQLDQIDRAPAAECRQLEEDLGRLAGVFDGFPSIAEERTLGGTVYSVDTLIDILYRHGIDHLALLPTRIAVGRSFAVAKTNFFGYLYKISQEHEELAGHRREVHRAWEMSMFSLLVEDVYQAIMERQDAYSPDVRIRFSWNTRTRIMLSRPSRSSSSA